MERLSGSLIVIFEYRNHLFWLLNIRQILCNINGMELAFQTLPVEQFMQILKLVVFEWISLIMGLLLVRYSIIRIQIQMEQFRTICEQSAVKTSAKRNLIRQIFCRYTLSPTSASNGTCTNYNVTPAYPLFTPNILIESEATFAGLVDDDLFYANREPLNAWDVLIAGAISATVFVDNNNTLVR